MEPRSRVCRSIAAVGNGTARPARKPIAPDDQPPLLPGRKELLSAIDSDARGDYGLGARAFLVYFDTCGSELSVSDVGNDGSVPNDLDVFVNMEHPDDTNYVTTHPLYDLLNKAYGGLTYVDQPKAPYTETMGAHLYEGQIDMPLEDDLVHETRKLQLVILDHKPAQQVCFNFDLPCLHMYFDGTRLVSFPHVAPMLRSRRMEHVYPVYVSHAIGVPRVARYMKKGFTFSCDMLQRLLAKKVVYKGEAAPDFLYVLQHAQRMYPGAIHAAMEIKIN